MRKTEIAVQKQFEFNLKTYFQTIFGEVKRRTEAYKLTLKGGKGISGCSEKRCLKNVGKDMRRLPKVLVILEGGVSGSGEAGRINPCSKHDIGTFFRFINCELVLCTIEAECESTPPFSASSKSS